MQCVDDYLKRGGPVVGLRTATHAFSNMDNPEWAHYSYNYDGPKKEWANGFGKLILGETWVSHYGANHKQASRLLRSEEHTSEPQSLMRLSYAVFCLNKKYPVYRHLTCRHHHNDHKLILNTISTTNHTFHIYTYY